MANLFSTCLNYTHYIPPPPPQRDLLFIAAAERCPKNTRYAAVREKWTMKCNDSIFGKALQLLTLAVYVTQDLQAGLPGKYMLLFSFVNFLLLAVGQY